MVYLGERGLGVPGGIRGSAYGAKFSCAGLAKLRYVSYKK